MGWGVTKERADGEVCIEVLGIHRQKQQGWEGGGRVVSPLKPINEQLLNVIQLSITFRTPPSSITLKHTVTTYIVQTPTLNLRQLPQ